MAAEEGVRNVQFFWVECGRAYRQVYNSNCKCNMLLDAIYKESIPAIAKAIKDRRVDIKTEILEIERKQEEYAEEERLAAEKAAANPAEPEVVEEPPPSASGKKKKGKDDKKKSKEEQEEEKRKLAEKQAEEEARKNLGTTKIRLGEEDEKLVSEFEALKEVKRVDLFDCDGAPRNLRNESDKYANTLLTPGAVYTLVSLQNGEDDQVTQSPIEISI